MQQKGHLIEHFQLLIKFEKMKLHYNNRLASSRKKTLMKTVL